MKRYSPPLKDLLKRGDKEEAEEWAIAKIAGIAKKSKLQTR